MLESVQIVVVAEGVVIRVEHTVERSGDRQEGRHMCSQSIAARDHYDNRILGTQLE